RGEHRALLAFPTRRSSDLGQFFTLDTNYRSTQGLVAAVNHLFQHADRHEAGAFLFKQEIPFAPVKAKGRREQLVVSGQVMPAMTDRKSTRLNSSHVKISYA